MDPSSIGRVGYRSGDIFVKAGSLGEPPKRESVHRGQATSMPGRSVRALRSGGVGYPAKSRCVMSELKSILMPGCFSGTSYAEGRTRFSNAQRHGYFL